MRLDFNVLWVDDQPNRVDAQITAITTQMEAEGFSFNPTKCTSIQAVNDFIAGNVFQDEIDLILVDWDLGGGVHGQDVIKQIRQVSQYKDVVFYSATETADLRRMVYDEGLEGIYCAHRDGLVDEVIGVFESLVKKVLDLDHMRGIVMGATSDIDHLVNTCLSQTHAILNEEGKRKFIEEALARIAKRVNKVVEQDEVIKKDPSVEAIMADHMIFTASDRLLLLEAILTMNEFRVHAAAKGKLRSYRVNVVPKRNQLGHLILTPEGKPQAVESSEGKPISLDEMRNLRKSILNFREDFRVLADALKA